MLEHRGILQPLFSSQTRIRLLSVLFLNPGQSFYNRQLERIIPGLPLRRELMKLESVGLLTSWREGNQKRYRLNPDFPIYEELRRIFLKTAGLGDIIREHLSKVKGVELAFIYGSFAKGEEHAGSDIDVMVVGEASGMELSVAFGKIEEELGRLGGVNYSLYERAEVKQRLTQREGFISAVFSEPKIMIQGDPDDELLTGQP